MTKKQRKRLHILKQGSKHKEAGFRHLCFDTSKFEARRSIQWAPVRTVKKQQEEPEEQRKTMLIGSDSVRSEGY